MRLNPSKSVKKRILKSLQFFPKAFVLLADYLDVKNLAEIVKNLDWNSSKRIEKTYAGGLCKPVIDKDDSHVRNA